MDQQALQRTRYLLQTRFRRIQTAPIGNFELVAKQVLDWLENHPILGPVLDHLDKVPGAHHQEIHSLLTYDNHQFGGSRYYHLIVKHGPKQEHEPEFKGYTPSNLQEHASACLQILRASITRPNLDFYCGLAVYLTQEDYGNHASRDKNPLEPLKDIAVHDLYEYLDEQLDGINAVNGLLKKYKQSVEWFQREHIQQILTEGYGGKTGERALALHLQQYIFDQSVDFVVEPSSVSGEVDLLLRDPSGQYTIIDAKLINFGAANSSEVTNKIAAGLNQVARYCADYNQPEGFLAVFVNEDVSILLDLEQNDTFRFFKLGGSIIYYIELNISKRPSASKSGKAKQITITRDQLLEKIEEVQRKDE